MTDLHAIAARCESLGRNCEFGFVQRELGHESLSLLRWAGVERADLIQALHRGFAGMGANLDVWPDPGGEWWCRDEATRIILHCGVGLTKPADDARKAVRRRLPLMIEKLLADISDAEKVLVFADATMTDPADGFDLLYEIRRISRAPVLLVASGPLSLGKLDWNAWGATLPALTGMGNANEVDYASWRDLLGMVGRKVHGQNAAAPALL